MKYRIIIAAIIYKTIPDNPYIRYQVERKRHWWSGWEIATSETFPSIEIAINAIKTVISPNDRLEISLGKVVWEGGI